MLTDAHYLRTIQHVFPTPRSRLAALMASTRPPSPFLPSKLLKINNSIQVSLTSIGNTIQAYMTTKNTREVYVTSGPETTALSSRLFGTWTVVSAVVRLYAAYNISNPQLYQLAIWSYAIAWVHFMSEWTVFKTVAWGRGLAGPVLISTGSLIWMVSQWGYYVQ